MKPHAFWQDLHPAGSFSQTEPFVDGYPVALRDGRQILLPIRPLEGGRNALASLIVNQASFAVEDALADDLAGKLAPFEPQIVVGLPTLGLTLARSVARRLGHTRYVPLGTSRKFWYEETLSVPLASITSPQAGKRLYVDPRMLPLLQGSRVALVDDVISTGTSIVAGLKLLESCDIDPVAIGAAMLQTRRSHERLRAIRNDLPERIRYVFETPILEATGGGWIAASSGEPAPV
ncbi:phosphoribosyltransferase [Pararhizobium mangrovi]|uniref:Phosphoribosyltransferase n=1 Tax=Pararhizobium mangrovi TaxID=2590452 RepID=A0A506TZJ0_9HYPH|nr:phosphoribosyltransferase [Pararhizobium mangrovi]TPW25739.1 phosphoribosyltransferase [Pararhizobium mangrovi]